METSIKNIEQAIVECEEKFNKDIRTTANCEKYKNMLMEKISADILKLKTTLDFRNRIYDLIEGDSTALKAGAKNDPYSDDNIVKILRMAYDGQLKFNFDPKDEAILETLYKAAKSVYEYGNAYCRLSRNSTVIIEDEFGDDASSITEYIYLSPAMIEYKHGIYQTWHWHGW